ncbi:hypothetical protein KFE96_07175 [Kordiimonas sp. SCSIO 12603]|uniref:hypothetical protein n=1 Tax=Kordiimonas sp. SCSIO 12603 TaxID=2829596 RepID=UPI002104AC7D|nr:hypothetical protein [Kordiimonas sp. SCSIO 12603]UTW60084.1 hypothetical protein KFE96_07175 [Kordiimonas sp. SCSIO 12603]
MRALLCLGVLLFAGCDDPQPTKSRAEAKAENQDMVWLKDRLENSPQFFEIDRPKAWKFVKEHKDDFPETSIISTYQDSDTFLEVYPVWVADFNADGKDDFLFEHTGGTASCVSVEVLVSSQDGYKFHTDKAFFNEADVGSCSGMGQITGVRPISEAGDNRWISYSFNKQGGHFTSLAFLPSGGVEKLEVSKFNFGLLGYVQASPNVPPCETELCQKALELSQPALQGRFDGVPLGISETEQTKYFTAVYEEAGKAGENPAHPYGTFAGEDVQLISFSHDQKDYIIKIADGALGWRRWCCGVSIYEATADGFEPAAHMFVTPRTRFQLVKD